MTALPPNAMPPANAPVRVMEPAQWQAQRQAHLARVRRWTVPHRERVARGQKHLVYDFLWEYYSHRPSQLERWHPGVGVVLEGDEAREFLSLPGYTETPRGVMVTPAALSPHRLESVRWIRDLLQVCAERPPSFGCFGLHEWAMVYRTPSVRHDSTPLRFPPGEMARIVESLPVRCSHFDAFRFFAPEARPLNRLQPGPETRLVFEQRGCVHVTMDLYKWAYKFTPLVPSECVADCFELALAARELDMRASPYDIRHLGFDPVKIETPEGRSEYEQAQRALSDRAVPLRSRLLVVCDEALG